MDRGEIIMEKTLAIIKPDATHRNIIGDIISTIEDSKFKVIRLSSMILTESKAKEFNLGLFLKLFSISLEL